jgi:hypothetical protein
MGKLTLAPSERESHFWRDKIADERTAQESVLSA